MTGAVNGDTLDYTLATTAVKFSGVGSYPITVTLGTQPELHGHQGRRHADGQRRRVATVTANAKSKTYGDDNPALDAVVTGAVNGDDASTTRLATTAVQFSGVGSYPITVTLGANPNYTVTTTDGTLTVNAGAGDGRRRRQEQDLRRGQPAADRGRHRAVAGGDRSTTPWPPPRSQFSNVGSYPITVSLAPTPTTASPRPTAR